MNFDTFDQLVRDNRSCRRFDNAVPVETDTLEKLVDLARNCASAANMQPLKFFLSSDPKRNEDIYSCLGWAAYLKDWKGPTPEERPAAYIIIMGDHRIADKFWCDHGIAAQTILLGARAMGLAGCMFAAVNTKRLASLLKLGEHLETKLVVALGKPVEIACIDDVEDGGDIRYWRDDNQVHHVPKRKLQDLIIGSC